MLAFACIYWALIVPAAALLFCTLRNDPARGETIALFACWGFAVLIFIGYVTAQPPLIFYIGRPF